MLSAREEAELEQRAAAQVSALPTTIEGFKTHSLYMLERHIGKYQVKGFRQQGEEGRVFAV
jgi:xeroderma pigmentosum group C-complementing protein